MIKINRDSLSEVRKFLCDEGYSGKNFAGSVREINRAPVEAVKRNELHKFVVLPKCRAAGRSFGWLDKAAGSGKIAGGNFIFAPNGDSGIYRELVEKILNRILSEGGSWRFSPVGTAPLLLKQPPAYLNYRKKTAEYADTFK
jgi:hypothetical protein